MSVNSLVNLAGPMGYYRERRHLVAIDYNSRLQKWTAVIFPTGHVKMNLTVIQSTPFGGTWNHGNRLVCASLVLFAYYLLVNISGL